MPDIDKIRKDLADTAHYHGQSYAAIVGVAAEIEAIPVESKRERKEGKHEHYDERAALRREFRELHGLTSVVWARVAKRWGNYANVSAQGIRAMAYCCQLPEDECMGLFEAHELHVNEPGALHLILRDVNDALDARRDGHGAKTPTLAEQCADVIDYTGRLKYPPETTYEIRLLLDKLAALPAVASVLARRAKLAECAHAESMRGYQEDLAEDARAIRAEAMPK